MSRKIIIGSRGSELALWQANFVREQLNAHGVDSEVVTIKTQGDKIQDLSFDKMEGKGFFTKEIEEALLTKQIDLAVHSHKDLETTPPKGLKVAAVSARANPAELLLIDKEWADVKKPLSLRNGASVGTSSARRKMQLNAFRSDIKLKDLRGNVPTRVQKLRDGEYNAIMLAAAGVERLDIDVTQFHVEHLDPKEFIPAPAQGVLALQCREEDNELMEALKPLNNLEVQRTSQIERKVLNLFQGGCQLPLGVYCERDEQDEEVFNVWAAKAEESSGIPQYIYLHSKRKDIAEVAVSKFAKVKPTSVFVTRDLHEHDLFLRTLTNAGYEVNGNALIKINRLPIRKMPEAEWLFFASKNAVKHFFQQKPEISGVRIGAIAKGTAAEIRKYGHKAEFIGYSTDTKMTAKQFLAACGRATVLFPQAKGSIRRVQQFLPEGKAIDLPVYETVKQDVETIPKAEVLFFTSPSNVLAYCERKQITASNRVIALGHATGSALQKKGVNDFVFAPGFDQVAMAMAVFSLRQES